jgi:hypothetical protein
MPGQFFTTEEKERLNKIPIDISKSDIISFFTLTDSDLNAKNPIIKNQNRILSYFEILHCQVKKSLKINFKITIML